MKKLGLGLLFILLLTGLSSCVVSVSGGTGYYHNVRHSVGWGYRGHYDRPIIIVPPGENPEPELPIEPGGPVAVPLPEMDIGMPDMDMGADFFD